MKNAFLGSSRSSDKTFSSVDNSQVHSHHPLTMRRPQAVRIFFQARDESVIINDDISVTVIEIDNDEVLLAIDAPEWVAVEGQENSGKAETNSADAISMRPR